MEIETQTTGPEAPLSAGTAIAVLDAETVESGSEPGPQPRPAREYGRISGFLDGVQSLLITIIIAVFVITFLIQAFQIPSESMENTLLIGDYLLVDKAQFSPPGFWAKILPYEEVRRGDIIVFRYPVDPRLDFVKRVVAIPGDRLHLNDGRVYVNGRLQKEPFAVYRAGFPDTFRDNFPNGSSFFNSNIDPEWWRLMREFIEGGDITVPAGRYFALGDNRNESLDSRYWGFVPRSAILGRPLLIYFSHSAFEVDSSAGNPGEVNPDEESSGADGKLEAWATIIRHWPDYVRWDRAFHVVH